MEEILITITLFVEINSTTKKLKEIEEILCKTFKGDSLQICGDVATLFKKYYKTFEHLEKAQEEIRIQRDTIKNLRQALAILGGDIE